MADVAGVVGSRVVMVFAGSNQEIEMALAITDVGVVVLSTAAPTIILATHLSVIMGAVDKCTVAGTEMTTTKVKVAVLRQVLPQVRKTKIEGH